MKKLDKKQIPQFAALCILSAGTFGFFVMRLVTPTPAAAGTRPHPVQEAAKPHPADGVSAATKAGAAGTASPIDAAQVSPPTAGMRDPFVVGYVDPKMLPAGAPAAAPAPPAPAPPAPAKGAHTQTASIEIGPASVSAPPVPSLPLGLKSFSSSAPAPAAGLPSGPSAPALPEAPAAPAWTVTGVLQNDTQHVAILRNGEARRIVRSGDFVDSQYRVVEVTRSSVTLRHGAVVYHLLLGGVPPAPVAAKGRTNPAKTSIPVPAMTIPGSQPAAKPQNAAPVSARQSAAVTESLTAIYESSLALAESFLTAIGTYPVHPVPAPAAPAPADQVAARLPEELPSAIDPNTAWSQALTMNNLDTAQAAETLLTDYH